jgi:hypothetical protein
MVKSEYSAQYIREALSVERLGGKCLFNLCAGGETLLSNEIIPIVRELLEEGHYIEIVTNGTLTKRFQSIIELSPDLLQRLIFKFSFHYLELKRLQLIDIFFDNIKMIREAGCSFTVEMTPNDELVEYIDEIKNICMDKLHALCHLTIARDSTKKNLPILSRYSFDEYKKTWHVFDSDMFNFKVKTYFKKQTDFCYAGEWSCYIDIFTGIMRQCYCGLYLQNIYTDIMKPINFSPIGKCELAYCYNAHAFLALGVIPVLDTPTYCDMRNRKDTNNKEWLNNKAKSFLSCKLKDNNIQYTRKQQSIITIKKLFRKILSNSGRIYRLLTSGRLISVLFRIISKIKRMISK